LSKKYNNIYLVFSIIIALGLLFGLVWGNIVSIHQNPVEKKFLVPWLGMRTFLELGKDPYGKPSAQRAQVKFFGSLANSKEDPLGLDQPFTSEILFFPIALITDYTIARIFWMVILELGLIASSFLCLFLFEWRLPIRMMILYSLVTVLGAQAFFPLQENDKAIIVLLLLITGLLLVKSGSDELAGALLSLSFFQPSATGILCLFLLWWVIRSKRWRVLWGMLMTQGFLIIVSFALLPGWFISFIRSFKTELPFSGYLTTYGILSKMWPGIGTKVALGLTIGIIILLILELKSTHNQDFRWFLWVAMFSLTISPLMGIPVLSVNNLFLLIPITYVMKILSERIKTKWRWLFTGALLGFIFLGGWVLKFSNLIFHESVVANNIILLIPYFIITFGLYWVRWWAIRPHQTWLDTIKSGEL